MGISHHKYQQGLASPFMGTKLPIDVESTGYWSKTRRSGMAVERYLHSSIDNCYSPIVPAPNALHVCLNFGHQASVDILTSISIPVLVSDLLPGAYLRCY